MNLLIFLEGPPMEDGSRNDLVDCPAGLAVVCFAAIAVAAVANPAETPNFLPRRTIKQQPNLHSPLKWRTTKWTGP